MASFSSSASQHSSASSATITNNSSASSSSGAPAVVSTLFFDWSARHFAQSVMQLPEENDPESMSHLSQEYRLIRASQYQREAAEEQKRAGRGNGDRILKTARGKV